MMKMPERTPGRRRDREALPFEEQLRKYQSAGVEITWRNARLPLEDIIRICMIRERGEYMCDFMADEQNHIVRINLNAVKDRAEDVVWDGVRADAGEETER